MFCRSVYRKKPAYLDIRGATTSLQRGAVPSYLRPTLLALP